MYFRGLAADVDFLELDLQGQVVVLENGLEGISS